MNASDERFPALDRLPSTTELPDPFTFLDGSRVRSRADWQRRREELKALILYYQYGHMPPAPGNVRAIDSRSADDRTTGATTTELRLAMGPDLKVTVRARLHVPTGRTGRFPVIVRGDLCWQPVAPEIVAEAMRREYAICDFDRTDIAPDNPDRSIGAYPVYGDAYDWRAIAAWAWGFHRVVDHLVTRPDIDPARVIATGHSRGGKTALLAGATDERIALTAPNNSGCGGAGCYRVQPADSEDIAAILKNFPFWFAPRFAQFIGHVDRLRFDQHSLKVLV